MIPSVRRNAVGSRRNGAKVGGDIHSSVHCPSSRQPHLARIRSHLNVVHAEIHEMAPAIGNVASAGAQRLHPTAVTERAVNLGVDTTLPDAGVCDAREICLSGDARAEPNIQRVIPNVEFPGVRCVHGGNEIDRVGMRHVHDVFVGPNGVKARNFVIWKFARLHRKSPARVRKARRSSLRFGPSQNGQIPRGPLLDPNAMRIILIR